MADSIKFSVEYDKTGKLEAIYLQEEVWLEEGYISDALLSLYRTLKEESFIWFDEAEKLVWFDLTNAVAVYKLAERNILNQTWKMTLLWGWLEYEHDEA